jgi:hypothetical protein
MSQYPPPQYPQSGSQYPAYPPPPQYAPNAYQQPPAAPQYAPNAYQQPPAAPQYAPNAYQQPPVAPAVGVAGNFPPDILQQAATYQLGNPLQIYKPTFSPAAAIGISIGVTVLDLVILVAMLVATDRFLIYLLVLPILMIIFAVRSVMYGNKIIYTFNSGMIHAKGQQHDAVRWDQIEAVWQRVVRVRYYYFYYRTSYKYTVRRNDGATFTFNNVLKKVNELGQVIQQEVTRLHAPKAIAAYNSGAPVVFGPFTLNVQGISNGRELLPWNMVNGIKINRGVVTVMKEGQMLRWGSARVENIPNYQVFVSVANHALRGLGKAVE